MSVQLLRNTRLWASTQKPGGSFSKSNTWEVLIQDDFAFNQDSNSTDIGLDEAGPCPTRGSKRFNDNLNPADWNFSTYLRPYLFDADASGDDSSGDYVLTPDYALWHCLSSGSELDVANKDGNGVTANDANMLVKFINNQFHQLATINLYYLVDNVWYVVHDVQINQAEISVDIEGIGMTAWSGQGTKIEPLGQNAPFDASSAEFTFPDKIFESASWIKNKLTTLLVKDNKDDTEYNIPITGATITINNNISYLTPNTLSRLDLPIGSFTGTFDVSGSLEAYLRSFDVEKDTDLRAADLLDKMIKDRSITNSFEIAICLGGMYPNPCNPTIKDAPGVVVVLPTAHLSVPTTETADVLGTSIEFKGIPTELDAGNEVYIGMSPKYDFEKIMALKIKGDGNASIDDIPEITTQPATTSLTAGDGLTLTVVANNADGYQWYKDGKAISGATSATYTVASAQPIANEGYYHVKVSNTDGVKVASEIAKVTVSI